MLKIVKNKEQKYIVTILLVIFNWFSFSHFF